MSNRERMLDLNREAEDQTSRLRSMNRVVNESNDTTTNIMRELGDQKEKINNQINLVSLRPCRATTSGDRSSRLTRRLAKCNAATSA
jgi:hypothetical protein